MKPYMHRLAQPEPLSKRTGTVPSPIRSSRIIPPAVFVPNRGSESSREDFGTHPNGGRIPVRCFSILFYSSLLLTTVLLATGCSDDSHTGSSTPSSTPSEGMTEAERTPSYRSESDQPFPLDGEWFWRDRLGIRPEPLDQSDPSPDLRINVERILAGMSDAPVKDPSFTALTDTAEALANLGPEIIPLLAARIRDTDRRIRWTVVDALSRIDDPRTIEPLLMALYDEEWPAAALLAVAALEHRFEPWIVPRLLKTLGPYPVDFNPHLILRIRAAGILVSRGYYAPIPFLIKVLKDNTPAMDPDREWDKDPRMAWAKEEALRVLTPITGDDFGFLVDAPLTNQARSATAFEAWWITNRDALWASAPPLEDPLLIRKVRDLIHGLSAFQARNADGARYCLYMLGPPVFHPLSEAVASGDYYERVHGLEILERLTHLAGPKTPEWEHSFQIALQDGEPTVRKNAARALGALARAGAVEALSRALDDVDPDVRLSALDALGRIGTPDAAARLVRYVEHAVDPGLRVDAKSALVRIASEHVEAFLSELDADDSVARNRASQRIIDMTGEDFGYDPSRKASQQDFSSDSLRAALVALTAR